MDILQIRHYLHARPELSGKELETAQFIVEKLRKCKPSKLWTNLGGTGVLAQFDAPKPGPEVLLRCELDALPIVERNTFAHRSTKPEISHKCGHDGHMAILLGVAQLLAEQPIKRGRLYLLFQPAEETGAGARAIMEDVQFQDIQPDYVFALHNLPRFPLHHIICRKGAFTPAVKSLIIKLEGATAHAAEPQNGISPAIAIAEILMLAQAETRSDQSQDNFFLITPIYANMGEKAYGVAAGAGEVHFTLRAHTNEQLQVAEAHFREKIRHIATENQLQIHFEVTDEFPSNDNDANAFEIVKAAAQVAGLNFLQATESLSWGEDFGCFTAAFPGALFGLGAGTDHPVLHSEHYDFPDELLESGVAIFNQIITQLLR
jgi:amidohydrolase